MSSANRREIYSVIQILNAVVLISADFKFAEKIYDATILQILVGNHALLKEFIGKTEDSLKSYYATVKKKIETEIVDKFFPSKSQSANISHKEDHIQRDHQRRRLIIVRQRLQRRQRWQRSQGRERD